MVKIKKRGRPNKIISSGYEQDVIDMKKSGKSIDEITSFLNEKGVEIKPRAVEYYFDKYFNIEQEGIKQYTLSEEKRKQELVSAGKEYSDDIKERDEIHTLAGKKLKEKIEKGKLADGLLVQIWGLSSREKRELLKIDSNNVEVNIENNIDKLSDLFDEDKIRRRLNEKRKAK